MDIGTKQHVLNRILCKAADLSQWPEKRASAQILIEEHTDSTWLHTKAWKQRLELFWIKSNQSLVTISPIGCKWNATCPRKGCQLRFKLISTATSEGCLQKLGNYVWHNSESITTKVCSQTSCKWNVMFESHVVTSVDRPSIDFQFEDFMSNLSL